jgi:hypothetical protein
MKIDRLALIRGMLVAANRERERRRVAEEARIAEAVERLSAELEEMGRRMLAVSAFREDLRDRELAEQMAAAPDWAHVDALRDPHDLSPAEAMALVLMVNPGRALQLLGTGFR